MSAPVVTTSAAPASGQAVIGDGTSARTRATGRWRRWRWPLAVAAIVLVAALLLLLVRPTVSDVPLGHDGVSDRGGRAAAQILERQGVAISPVRTTADAVTAARRGGTLLITSTTLLGWEQLDALVALDVDLVVGGPEYWTLDSFAPGMDFADDWSADPRTPRCDDPDAVAAEQVDARSGGLRGGGPGVTLCFPGSYGDSGVYAVIEDGDRRIVLLDDPDMLTNARLADEGNAALMLRALGRHEHLVWYVPSATDPYGWSTSEPEPGSDLDPSLPPWVALVLVQLLLAVAFVAVWRGRRLGRLVTEPLPVTVRSAETTLGRGRLYRRSRSYGHAAAGLRAGTAARTAARLGLPRGAGAPQVIDALCLATGRPRDEIAALLYGPPPTDDAGLLLLARLLDTLESEVHRT